MIKEYSKVTLINHMGNDLSVVNAARVSFDKISTLDDKNKILKKDEKLISFLAKNGHTSPFNHTFISFRIKAPIFVARQLVKHSYMPWNEVSRRYVDDIPTFSPIVWRKAIENVKQGSGDEFDLHEQAVISKLFWESVDKSLATYEQLLVLGVAPEQARVVLSLNTNTDWIWSGTLFAISRMYNLRIDGHAQKETQEIAKLIGNDMKTLYPVSWDCLTAKK